MRLIYSVWFAMRVFDIVVSWFSPIFKDFQNTANWILLHLFSPVIGCVRVRIRVRVRVRIKFLLR